MHKANYFAALTTLFTFACSPGVQIELSGQVRELGKTEGLEGVEVCLAGADEASCQDTDAQGFYTLTNIPGDSQISLTVSKLDFLGGTIPVETKSSVQQVPVVSLGGSILMELQLGILEVDAVEATGQIAFSISNGINGDGVNIAQIQVSLDPLNGDGPFYANDSGLPDPALTETSANGGGVFVNVAPGQYTLNHSNLPDNCTPMLGWGPTEQPAFEVFAGRVTYIRIECPQ